MDVFGPDNIKKMKQEFYPCLACCCAEQSCDPKCTEEGNPKCFTAGKVCCCFGSASLSCPPCWCEPESPWTQEMGCCQLSQKMCCLYSEVQFPPGSDIGCGCCGCAVGRTSDDGEKAGNE